MKSINDFLNKRVVEKLKITKDNIMANQQPANRGELVHYLQTSINNTDNDFVDLTNVDCSNIDDLSDIFPILDVPSYIKKIDVTGWEVSNVTNFNSMFASLYFIEEIIGLDTWDMSSALTINSMFYKCLKLKKIDLGNWKLDKIGTGTGISETTLSNVFSGCTNLEEINGIENWDLSKITRTNLVFWGCESLKKVNISNWNLSSCRSINCLFGKCSELEEVDISNIKFSSYFKKFTRIFEGCVKLHTIKGIENLYVKNITDMSSAFRDCKNLKADISKWSIPIFCTVTCAFMHTNSKIFKKPDILKKK